MKKVILSALVSVSIMGAASATTSSFSGFYLGGGLTYAKGKLDLNYKDSATGYNKSFNQSSGGFGIGTFLGYGCEFSNHFYLGGELGLGLDGSRINKTTSLLRTLNVQTKSNSRWTSSLTARIGYVFSNTVLAYVKLGFESRAKMDVTLINPVTNATAKFGSLRRSGALFGLGADYAINKNVFLRAEYTLNTGTKTTYKSGTQSATFKTKTSAFMIGAAYKF